MNANFKVG